MDALLPARIQFGVTIGLHYLYAVSTLGLLPFILVFETAFLIRRRPLDRALALFLTRLLGLIFVGGVATGLMLPFAFGANWSRFSAYAGAVFGPLISIEATAAFALESAFLAILLYGRNQVSPGGRWLAAVGVFLGAHGSGFLIVAANSWLQTPAGFILENDRLAMTRLRDVLLNPSTLARYAHVITAAWLTGAFALSGLAAYYAARRRHPAAAQALFRIALPLALITAAALPVTGRHQMLIVRAYQPEKAAAFAGAVSASDTAPTPSALPRSDPPPTRLVHTVYRLMVILGGTLLLVAVIGVGLLWRNTWSASAWYVRSLPWLVPLPYLANELGWIGTEVGRQPWLIYNILRTAEACSPDLPAWQVIVTLTGVGAVYLLLTALTLFFLGRRIRQGPETA